MTGIPAKELLYSGFKKLLSEYETASSPSSFPSVMFGKILSSAHDFRGAPRNDLP